MTKSEKIGLYASSIIEEIIKLNRLSRKKIFSLFKENGINTKGKSAEQCLEKLISKKCKINKNKIVISKVAFELKLYNVKIIIDHSKNIHSIINDWTNFSNNPLMEVSSA